MFAVLSLNQVNVQVRMLVFILCTIQYNRNALLKSDYHWVGHFCYKETLRLMCAVLTSWSGEQLEWSQDLC